MPITFPFITCYPFSIKQTVRSNGFLSFHARSLEPSISFGMNGRWPMLRFQANCLVPFHATLMDETIEDIILSAEPFFPMAASTPRHAL